MTKKRFRLGSNPLEWIKSTVQNDLNINNKNHCQIEEETSESPVFETTYFHPHWEEAGIKLKKGIHHSLSAPLLVLTASADVLPALQKSAPNDNFIQVRPGNSYHKEDSRTYKVNIRDMEDYSRLAADLVNCKMFPGNILHLWSWPGTGEESRLTLKKDDLDDQLHRGLYSLFYLTRALMEQKSGGKVKLLYVYPKPAEKNLFYGAYPAVGAFIRTLRLENPNFLYKTVGVRDLSFHDFPDELLAEFEPPTEPVEISFHGKEKQRYARRLKEVKSPGKPGNPLPLKKNGVYLITGGMGKLGLIFADYLVKKVNAKIVLIGRSEPGAGSKARVLQLKSPGKKGTEVLYMKADVANPREVAGVVKKIKSRFKLINGIIHCAGVKNDNFILKKTYRQIKAVLEPKVHGTVVLDKALSREKLDFFLICSSISAFISNVGQCDYAYANSFINEFANWRGHLEKEQKRYGRTISINWPLWQEGGMQISKQDLLVMREQAGLEVMPTPQGINILENALRSDDHQYIAAYGQREKLKRVFEQPVLAPPTRPPIAKDDKSSPDKTDPDQLTGKTSDFLKQVFGEIIKLSPRQINPKVRFEEYGIDSIMVTRFNTTIEKELGSISKTLLFEHQNLEELTRYFLENHASQLIDFFQLQVREKQEEDPGETNAEDIPLEPWPELKSIKEKFLHQPIRGQRESEEIKDIAIIGLSGRYPMANDIGEFWENLKQGKDCITEIPANRWDYQLFHGPGAGNGGMYCRWGGFLENIDQFEPLLFNISPREAASIDPQERLFLETVWETLENSGYTRKELGARVGVFVGVTTHTYHLLGPGDCCPNSWSTANRVSFVFNFHGPSMPVDTACSSSLTALHLACESLKKRECQFAIAGGVNLYMHPSRYREMCGIKMLSFSGKCHTFGEKGDGFVPGEGVGALLLKPLQDAVRDNDHIYAVIKSTSINHGGRTNGYTVPNPNAQGELILDALEKAGIDPGTINTIEAHGTGTILGDPVEISGLSKAFGKYTNKKSYCSIGSVKTNIGHLESAAGIAGLTKILLQMKHRQLVPSLHAEYLNPNIDFEQSPFYLQQELTEWKPLVFRENGIEKICPRRAGLSSFGAGGSNAHVILEEAPRVVTGSSSLIIGNTPVQYAPPAKGPYLILLSARNEERLKEYAGRLKECLENTNENQGSISLEDLAYTLQVGRESMNQRIAMVVTDRKDLHEKLLKYCSGDNDIEEFYSGNIKTDKKMLERFFNGKIGEDFINKLLEHQELPRLAWLWVSGLVIDWRSLYRGQVPYRISLPTYPFARKRYWKSPIPENHQLPGGEAQLHPLLDGIAPGQSLEYTNGLVFRKTFRETDWVLRHHQVSDRCILPGVAYLEMAFAAFSQIRQPGEFNINRVVLLQPLAVQNEPEQVRIAIEKYNNKYRFEIGSEKNQQTIIHARGEFFIHDIPAEEEDQQQSHLSIEAIKARCQQAVNSKELYNAFAGMGLHYGPYFQGVKQIFTNPGTAEALGVLSLPTSDKSKPDCHRYTLHPTLMDSAMQTLAGLDLGRVLREKEPTLPFSFEKVEMFHPLREQGYAYVKAVQEQGKHPDRYQVTLLDEAGRVCVRLHDVTLRKLKQKDTGEETGDSLEHFFYRPYWLLSPSPETPGFPAPEGKTLPERTVLVVYSPEAAVLEKALERAHTSDHLLKIELGTQTRQKSPNLWEINTAEPLSLERQISKYRHLDIIYFLGGIEERDHDTSEENNLEKSQERGVISLFRLTRALDKLGFAPKPLQLTVITNNVLHVQSKDIVIPYAAGLHGLVGTMAREYSKWRVNCVDISLEEIGAEVPETKLDTLALSILSIQADSSHPTGEPVALRQGKRYHRKIQPIILPPVNQTPLRQKGVYLILGGAGGIGLELSRYLARNVQARLILLGRRKQNQLEPQQKEKIEEIRARGGELLYIQADATNLASMKTAVNQAKSRFGLINGVVHSAIVLKDKTLANMDEETFQAALAPKIKGSMILYEVLKDEHLDFMIFFSSTQSFFCNAGQGNYAAGCTFKDAFALYLDQKTTYPVKIINWGYWGSVGIVSSGKYQELLTKQGFGSITPREGMAAVHRVLAHQVHQVISLKADAKLLETILMDPQHRVLLYPPYIPSLVEPVIQQTQNQLKNLVEEINKKDFISQKDWYPALQQFMSRLLLHAFRQMNVFQTTDQSYDKESLQGQLKIIPGYNRLYEALLDILNRAGFIQIKGNSILTTLEPELEHRQENSGILENTKNDLMEKYPQQAAYINLAFVCINAYPEILTGKKSHMEIMFPGGSLELVEPVYKANKVVDFYNKLVALVVTNYIQQRLDEKPGENLQLLEVGTGTGGTARLVVDAIKQYGKNISYYYTDISGKFIHHGKKTFSRDYPFVKFNVLDIEKSPMDQGYEAGSIDLVIATNVLHATKTIDNTLGQIKKLLKTNGLVVINEATVRDDFNSLTFGLTPGWWLYQDEALRIRHSPLLSPAQWLQALESAGFRHFHILGLPRETGEEARLSVIAGESNGEVIKKAQVQEKEKEQEQKKKISSPTPTSRSQSVRDRDDDLEDLEEIIKGVLWEVLHIDRVEFDPEVPFQDYGVDSLLAVEIIDKINEKLKIDLRATDLFNYSSIRALTDHIVNDLAYRIGFPGDKAKEIDEIVDPSMKPEITQEQGLTKKMPVPDNQIASHNDNNVIELIQRLQMGEINVDEADRMLGGF